MTHASRSGRSERGSATVLLVASCLVVLLVGSVAAGLAGASRATAQAHAAADLSALAGAGAQLERLRGRSDADPCLQAAVIAARNDATVTSCSIDAQVNVTVAVAVTLTGALARMPGLGVTTAQARAGPAPGTDLQPATSQGP